MRRLLPAVLAVAAGLAVRPALASDLQLGFSQLTSVCPSQFEIDFAWKPVNGVAFYSLQLLGPTDPSIDGAVNGTYLRQFGAIEVSKTQSTNATVTLNQSSVSAPLEMSWQVMLGGQRGYLGLVPTMQTADVIVPCTQNTLAAAAVP